MDLLNVDREFKVADVEDGDANGDNPSPKRPIVDDNVTRTVTPESAEANDGSDSGSEEIQGPHQKETHSRRRAD